MSPRNLVIHHSHEGQTMIVFYSKGRSEAQHNDGVLNIVLPCETLHNSSLIDIRVRLQRSKNTNIHQA